MSVQTIEREPNPHGIVDAADLVAREGTHRVQESDIKAMLDGTVRPRENKGQEWQDARDALLHALAAVRRAN